MRGTTLLLAVLGVLYLIALKCMRKLNPPKEIVPVAATEQGLNVKSTERKKKNIQPSVTAKYVSGYIYLFIS